MARALCSAAARSDICCSSPGVAIFTSRFAMWLYLPAVFPCYGLVHTMTLQRSATHSLSEILPHSYPFPWRFSNT